MSRGALGCAEASRRTGKLPAQSRHLTDAAGMLCGSHGLYGDIQRLKRGGRGRTVLTVTLGRRRSSTAQVLALRQEEELN